VGFGRRKTKVYQTLCALSSALKQKIQGINSYGGSVSAKPKNKTLILFTNDCGIMGGREEIHIFIEIGGRKNARSI